MAVSLHSVVTPKTHYLFVQIVATVGLNGRGGMSVREIAGELKMAPDIVAHCIALHVHLERQTCLAMPIPLPKGYWVPEPDEIIDRVVLEPPGGRACVGSYRYP